MWCCSPWLQCTACFLHLVLSGVAQALLHKLSPVSFVQRLLLLRASCEIALLGHLIEKGLQSDSRVMQSNPEYAFSRNPQYLRKHVFPFC